MTEFVDTIVAGGGTAGSAAAWQLARRGAEVLLLEASAVVDDGPGRAFELAYADPVYQALAAESVGLWQELEGSSAVDELSLLDRTPLLDRTGAVLHGDAPRLEAAGEALARARLASEILSAADAESRWPGLRFGGSVLFAPQGGRLREGAAIAALRAAATAEGARIADGSTITRIRILGDDLARLEVRTPAEGAAGAARAAVGADASGVVGAAGDGAELGEVREIECRRLVVTLGPSTAKLLRGLVTLPRISTTRDSSIVLPASGAQAPAVVHFADPTAPGQRYWRGDAAVLGGAGTVAVGWRDLLPTGASSAPTTALPPRELAALLRYAREWLPGADSELPTPTSRVRTSAHHGDFVVDRIGPVVVGAGFGAAGAGLAPAVGRLLAGLVEGTAAPSRFALRPDRRRAFDPSAHDSARRA